MLSSRCLSSSHDPPLQRGNRSRNPGVRLPACAVSPRGEDGIMLAAGTRHTELLPAASEHRQIGRNPPPAAIRHSSAGKRLMTVQPLAGDDHLSSMRAAEYPSGPGRTTTQTRPSRYGSRCWRSARPWLHDVRRHAALDEPDRCIQLFARLHVGVALTPRSARRHPHMAGRRRQHVIAVRVRYPDAKSSVSPPPRVTRMIVSTRPMVARSSRPNRQRARHALLRTP